MSRIQCHCCGEYHDAMSMGWVVPAPAMHAAMSKWLRWYRCKFLGDRGNPDLCIIDEKYYFIRAQLELPITDGPGAFSWGVWASLSEKNFERSLEMWNDPKREAEPPYFGWFSVALPVYPDTLHLKCWVHTQAPGCRPLLELEQTDHPLSIEQHSGITMARAAELAVQMIHQGERL
jgi:hypothetical protein